MSERDDTATNDETIGCAEAVRRLAAYLDGELDAEDEDEVERHLDRCRSCFSRAEFEKRLRARIRQDLKEEPVSPEFESRVRSLLRRMPKES